MWREVQKICFTLYPITKYPILLPKNHHVTDLTILHCHNDDRRKKIDSFSANYFLEDDVLYHWWKPKIYGSVCRTRKQLVVPSKERGKILMHCHNEQGHPGFMQKYSKIKVNYFWITMKKDIARRCKNCKGYAKWKSPKNRKRVPLNPIESNAPL